MQAAAPYIDDLLAVNNLASLEDLALHLNTLSSVRPERPQRARPEGGGGTGGVSACAAVVARLGEPHVPTPDVGQGDGGAVDWRSGTQRGRRQCDAHAMRATRLCGSGTSFP